MDQFYKQDIFFFVTTIAVIVVGIVITVAIIYIIKILRDVKYISKKAKAETDNLAQDLQELRANVKQQGFKAKHALNFFSKFLKRHKK